MVDHHYRSLLKGVSYRIIGTITTVAITYTFTRQTGTALTVGLVDVLVKVLIYYLHERAWNRITFGQKPVQPIDYQI